MRKTNLSFIVIIALLAGLVCGVLLSQTQMGKKMLARASFQPNEFESAKEFRLVDENGRTLTVSAGDSSYGR